MFDCLFRAIFLFVSFPYTRNQYLPTMLYPGAGNQVWLYGSRGWVAIGLCRPGGTTRTATAEIDDAAGQDLSVPACQCRRLPDPPPPPTPSTVPRPIHSVGDAAGLGPGDNWTTSVCDLSISWNRPSPVYRFVTFRLPCLDMSYTHPVRPCPPLPVPPQRVGGLRCR